MSFWLRRSMLGAGAVCLVGGWGLTRYVDMRQTAIAEGGSDGVSAWVGKRTKASSLVGEEGVIAGKTIYLIGVTGMSLGAMLVIVAFPKGSWQPEP